MRIKGPGADDTRRRMTGALLTGCLIVAGCGGTPSTPPTASPTGAAATASAPASSPSASPASSVSASPVAGVLIETAAPAGFESKITCSGSIGASDPVAIVTTQEGSKVEVIMRDYAEVTNPRTVCTFRESRVHLLDARHVMLEPCSAIGTCAWAIVDLPDVRYHWYGLPTTEDAFDGSLLVAPDLASVAWTEREIVNDDHIDRTLFVRDATGDHLVSDLEPVDLGDCGPPVITVAAFAPVGRYLSVMDRYEIGQLYIVGGHDLEQRLDSVDSAVWSPTSSTLYFGKSNDVFQWTPDGGATVLRRDLQWKHPTISPNGRSLAYSTPNGHGGHDIYIADPAHLDQARRIAENASRPVFLNNARLWYMTEGTSGCGGEEVPPREMVYNLTTSTAATTVITDVLSVWPATTSGSELGF